MIGQLLNIEDLENFSKEQNKFNLKFVHSYYTRLKKLILTIFGYILEWKIEQFIQLLFRGIIFNLHKRKSKNANEH